MLESLVVITRFDKLQTELPHPKNPSPNSAADGSDLEVQVGSPEGFDPPDLVAEPQLTAPVGPDIDPEMFQKVAVRLFPEMNPKRKTTAKTRAR